MKKLKIKNLIVVLIFLIFVSTKVFSEDKKQYDEAYIEIKSKSLKDDFFMVRYDYENEDVFIPVKGLFYFLEIYSVKIDLDKKRVEYEIDNIKTKVQIKSGSSFILDDELYINLKGIEESFDFGDLKWSGQDLKLILTPNFILPFEIREKGKVERIRLKDKKENLKLELIKPERKIIAPGLLKLRYSTNDIQNSEVFNFDMEYGTQFLYSDFYINYNLEPEGEIKTYNFTYNNVYKENDFIVGDFYIRTPDFLNIDSSVNGFSFGEKNTYSSTSGNVTTVKGEAQGAEVIELYQNGILLDYQRPSQKIFIFEIRDRSFSGEYTLKIYYQNGQIENRKVYTVGDARLLNKNEWSYNIQVGETKEQHKTQTVNEISYGLYKNLSLGIGVLNLESDENREYNLLKNEIIYRMEFSNFPLLINLQNFYEYKVEENSYEFRINQKIKNYILTSEHFKYSEYLSREENIKEYNSVGVTRDFLLTRIGLGYQEKVKFLNSEKSKGYYVNLENRNLKNISLFLDVEMNYNESGDKALLMNPGVSYGGLSDYTMIFQTTLYGDKSFEVDYSLKVLGKRKTIKNTNVEYITAAELRYDEQKKTYASLDFTVYLDEYIYAEIPFTKNENGNFKIGVNAEKVIDLSDLKREVKDRQVDNSWIYGKVYIDSNDNSKYDIGETTLPEVVLVVDGKKVVSDKNGNYFISGLLPLENYKIRVDRKSIDPMLVQVVDKKEVQTRASIGTEYNVGVQAISMLTGNINSGENINSEELIRILSMTTITLEKEGEVYLEVDPEFDGMYFFENVLPGEYKIKFNYLGNDNIVFSEKSLLANIKLLKEDEGEYFEGYDIIVKKQNSTNLNNLKEENENYDLEDILKNF
ncbi:MAG: hypothetical protein ACRC34_00190 [Cetobacterium sp.]